MNWAFVYKGSRRCQGTKARSAGRLGSPHKSSDRCPTWIKLYTLMSSPLAAVPFPSAPSPEPEEPKTPRPEDVALPPDTAPASPKAKPDDASIVSEAKERFENKSAADEELRESLGKMITLCTKLVRLLHSALPPLTYAPRHRASMSSNHS